MLRIHDFGLLGIDIEKRGVEQTGILQHGAGLHKIRFALLRRAVEQRSLQFIFFEKGDRLHAVAKVAPEFLDVFRAWKAPGHADDGHVFALGFRRVHSFALAPNGL